ncbi:acyltransferase family protein, partial [Roseicella frigidaeris]
MILSPLLVLGLLGLALAAAGLVLRLSPAARGLLAAEAGRTPALDGLRGLLALSVFVHHAVITWFFLLGRGWALPPSRLHGQLGQVGVALFFMVTAFLFWGRVLARRGRLDWGGFLIGRLWRLYPAWLLALAGVLLAVLQAGGWRWRQPAGETLRGLGAWLLFAYPAPADLNGFAGTGRLLAYAAWSLPYEVLFYALLPLAAMLVFRAPRPGAILACLGMMAGMLALAGGHWIFQGPVLASFAGGIAAAHVARRPALRAGCASPWAVPPALLALGLVLFGLDTAYAMPATLLLTLVFVPVACGNGFGGALTRPALVWLGQASYSLYLLHGLVLWLVADRLGGWLDPGRGSEALYAGLLLLACPLLVLLASLAALGVEQPGIAAGRRQAARRAAAGLRPAAPARIAGHDPLRGWGCLPGAGGGVPGGDAARPAGARRQQWQPPRPAARPAECRDGGGRRGTGCGGLAVSMNVGPPVLTNSGPPAASDRPGRAAARPGRS